MILNLFSLLLICLMSISLSGQSKSLEEKKGKVFLRYIVNIKMISEKFYMLWLPGGGGRVWVRLVKATVSPVVMYGCESWTIKKAECRRIGGFELWCWRRLLRIPWTARRSNQSILKEISPGCSLEGLMLKLKLQYFGHLMQRTNSLEKTLMLGKIEGGRRRGATEDEMVGWHHQLDGHESEQGLGLGDGQGGLACCSPWGRRVGHNWATELNWWGPQIQCEFHTYIAPFPYGLVTFQWPHKPSGCNGQHRYRWSH